MMYFNDKDNTNIDDEFKKDNILSLILKFLNKYKLFVFIFFVVVLIIMMILMFINRKVINYLILDGEKSIILYQGSDYIEPGYNAYNSKEEDLDEQVEIESTLDTNTIGEYEITYTIGEVTKVRKITIIEKPDEYTYIYLKTVDNSVNVFVKVGESYTEPGYQVFSSTGKDLTSEVKVIGAVDTSKKGNYKLNYSVVDSNGVTVSASRTVIVMDTEISLSLSTEDYTNKEVTISIGIADNYFDYMLLPDDTRVMESTYEYKVSSNGKYTFKVYNTKGVEKEASIEVKNIDKIVPTGSCTVDQNQNGSFITVTASDESGIKKYEYNGKSYTNSKISLTTFVDNAKVTVYDNSGNNKEITCKSVALPVVSSITNDGVIVTINAKKVNSDISGYYFSYTNKRPDKTGGYLATNKESIDVVRLPGTTYVWVEDSSGKISQAKTITLTNEVLPKTLGAGYTVLRSSLSERLSRNGWSVDELNKLIARSVRAAGLYTKEGAATSAVALQLVLVQKYKITIPYRMGGKINIYGASPYWGSYSENKTYDGHDYSGLDCGGFVNWTYYNTGIESSNFSGKNYYFYWDGIEYSKENGEVGDVLRTFARPDRIEHVAIIVGKTDTAFLVAEAYGYSVGLIINTYPYDNPNGYEIIKGEELITRYTKVENSKYPSGF